MQHDRDALRVGGTLPIAPRNVTLDFVSTRRVIVSGVSVKVASTGAGGGGGGGGGGGALGLQQPATAALRGRDARDAAVNMAMATSTTAAPRRILMAADAT